MNGEKKERGGGVVECVIDDNFLLYLVNYDRNNFMYCLIIILFENFVLFCFGNLSISFCIMIFIFIYIICKFV